MFNTMQNLSNSLGAFHADTIGSGLTQNVTVVVMSEFGRNARQNGSAGTGMVSLVPAAITEEEAWTIINYERSFCKGGEE